MPSTIQTADPNAAYLADLILSSLFAIHGPRIPMSNMWPAPQSCTLVCPVVQLAASVNLFGPETHTHSDEEMKTVSSLPFTTVAWSSPHIFQHNQAQSGRKESSTNGKFLFYQHLWQGPSDPRVDCHAAFSLDVRLDHSTVAASIALQFTAEQNRMTDLESCRRAAKRNLFTVFPKSSVTNRLTFAEDRDIFHAPKAYRRGREGKDGGVSCL
jgi:hypothetical protein